MATGRAEHWNPAQRPFHVRTPVLAPVSLAGHEQKEYDHVCRRQQDEFCPKKSDHIEVAHQLDKPGNGENKNREVEDKKWISQVSQDAAAELGAFIVIAGEQAKTFGQAAAFFAGLNERQIE